jgi:hypothetical protein
MLVWVGAVGAFVALFVWWRYTTRARLRQSIEANLATALAHRIERGLQPDMKWAAQGFAHIADARRFNLSADLQDTEWKYARLMEREEQLNPLQLMSCRWGAGHAIDADLMFYEEGLEAFREAVKEGKKRVEELHPLSASRAAALGHLTLVLQQAPEDFYSFVRAASSGRSVGLRD